MSALSIALPDNVRIVLDTLHDAGFEGYIVGGCVRDALRGVEPHDYDVTTNALPSDTLRIFRDFRVIETGLKHGTVTVISDNAPIEITTFRIDGEYRDNRHPDCVRFTPRLADDLERRDFTVNAMAYSPQHGLVDLFGGVDHLANRVITCVGSPDLRFNEDGLRIMRALRFASVLDFDIAPDTARAILDHRLLLRGISRERIFSELIRLVCGTAAGRVVGDFADVLCVVIPGLTPDDIAASVGAYAHCPALPALRLALLLHSLSPDDAALALRELRCDNHTVKAVSALLGSCDRPLSDDRICARRLAHDLGFELGFMLLELQLSLFSAQKDYCATLRNLSALLGRVRDDGDCISLSSLAVRGNDLIAAGLSGCAVGRALELLLDMVICDRLPNEREALLAAVDTLCSNDCL